MAGYCNERSVHGMVNVRNRHCSYESCTRAPTPNFAGEKKAAYSKGHAVDSMVNVVSRRCSYDRCPKIPTFNIEARNCPAYSKQHAEDSMIDVPRGITPSALTESTNFLNARLRGRTMADATAVIQSEIAAQKAELSALTQRVVEAGLAVWSGSDGNLAGTSNSDPLDRSLIVTGQSKLLEDVSAMEDLERVRLLFQELENKADLVQLLDLAQDAEGVRLFIGSENQHFALSGSSVIVSPFMDESRRVVGVLGVIGPTRLNYARIIPMVDYTAQVVGRLLR